MEPINTRVLIYAYKIFKYVSVQHNFCFTLFSRMRDLRIMCFSSKRVVIINESMFFIKNKTKYANKCVAFA